MQSLQQARRFARIAGMVGLWTSVLALGTGVGAAHANPKNPTVVAGQATVIKTAPTDLTVRQQTAKAIINWQGFSIGTNEQTKFEQPNASSVTLNRVTGGDPSQILGRLNANGTVMLVNPNGVVFGRDSRIDVNGLVATTHDIRNEDFLAGKYNFNIPGKLSAAVVNQGTITAAEGGLVALVAPGVENSGLISARLGRITLASGNAFTLDLYGDQLVRLVVDQPAAAKVYTADGRALSSFVDNSGTIQADGGTVVLTANAVRGLLTSVVNTSGLVRAQTVESKDGAIILHGGSEGTAQVSGTLDVSGKGVGQRGGSVQVTGEQVGLLAGARVDASGAAGGGVALIGGDYKGGKGDPVVMAQMHIVPQRKPVPNAKVTYVDQQVTVTADAKDAGKGGKVVVWSDQATGVYGSLSARGGQRGGDGGFIETSSAGYLDVNGAPNVSAPSGASGTWLLDPYNVVITNDRTTSQIISCQGSGNAGACGVILGSTIQDMFRNAIVFGNSPIIESNFVGGINNSVVNARDIEFALNNGANVIVNTAGTLTDSFERGPTTIGTQAGTIDVRDSITKSAGRDGSLSLNATSDLTINAPIASTAGKLNVTLKSDTGRITSAQNIQTNGGSITLDAPGNIELNNSGATRSGNLTITAYGGDNANVNVRWGSDRVQFTHDSTRVNFPENGIFLTAPGVSTRTNFRNLDGVYHNNAVTLRGSGTRFYNFSFSNGVYGAAQPRDEIPEFVGFDFSTFSPGRTNNVKNNITPYFEVSDYKNLKVFPLDPTVRVPTTEINTNSTLILGYQSQVVSMESKLHSSAGPEYQTYYEYGVFRLTKDSKCNGKSCLYAMVGPNGIMEWFDDPEKAAKYFVEHVIILSPYKDAFAEDIFVAIVRGDLRPGKDNPDWLAIDKNARGDAFHLWELLQKINKGEASEQNFYDYIAQIKEGREGSAVDRSDLMMMIPISPVAILRDAELIIAKAAVREGVTATAGKIAASEAARIATRIGVDSTVNSAEWLLKNEALGGHIIKEHVGKSIEYLAERASREGRTMVSSFADEAAATYSVREALSSYDIKKLSEWAIGTNGRNTLEIDVALGKSIGYGVESGGKVIQNLTNARVVLQRMEDGSFYILTAFPR